MNKRYRRPKVSDGEIKIQMGKIDGDVDMCIFHGGDIPRCDRALLLIALGSKRQRTDFSTMKPVYDPSILDELDARGYDLDTLRFYIKRKDITQ